MDWQKMCSFCVVVFFGFSGILAFSADAESYAIVSPSTNDLDISSMIQPVGEENILSQEDHYVWGGSGIEGEDGKYYLFYARWPKGMTGRAEGDELFSGFRGWLKYSEIAVAVSDEPAGPFKHLKTIITGTKEEDKWHRFNAHNPHIKRFDGKLYLYYIGTNPAEGIANTWYAYANGQKIGVAVASSVQDFLAGDFEICDEPLVEPDEEKTHQRAVNPSVTRGHDGRYYMMFKSRAKPLGGKGDHMTHWCAASGSPDGPFELVGPVLQGGDYSAEDPYFWYDKGRERYYAIVKNFSRSKVLAPQFGALALITSTTPAKNWRPAKNSLVSLKQYTKPDGSVQKLNNLERPQLLFDGDGKPIALYAASAEKQPWNNNHTVNVQFKLAEPAEEAQGASE
ncbi:Beta-xylosidase [Anaerohalosphaera lusitana]|uniref:Beta-xylosidase n=1 Tax=Anaerohalosphaera lusitana TaxID=1936003 RepID=A0A1U9NMY1_9BACT|nr:glycoside hydrolase family protein [Anaerohalosphaera lusitana]AQT69259.1 Beta-xylosidase [Anaerohalosphaera lusitana]